MTYSRHKTWAIIALMMTPLSLLAQDVEVPISFTTSRHILLGVAIVVIQFLLIKLTNWLYRRWKFRLTRIVMRRTIPLVIKDYEVLNKHRQGMLFLVIFRLARIVFIAFQGHIRKPGYRRKTIVLGAKPLTQMP